MKIEEYSGNKKRKVLDFDISSGLSSGRNISGRKIVSMENISPRAYPCVEPRRPYFVWEMEKAIDSIGAIDGVVYYNRSTIFYYGGHLSGGVTTGKKT